MSNYQHELIDVSHVVEDGVVTYKGLPAPIICDFLSREASKTNYDAGTTFQIGKIEMVANTGTYVDSPFHRYEDGKDLSELDLYTLANLDGIVFRVDPGVRAIGKDIFGNVELKGKAVLVHTGWDRYWNTERYFEGHPYLTREAAEYLKASKAALVGIDSLNIDDTSDGKRPVHTILLGADIPIVEHMCHLDQLPDHGFKFFAVPVKVKGFGTFPVRAFGLLKR
jgi:kynurenine formamidase